jgi:hypothetical protein
MRLSRTSVYALVAVLVVGTLGAGIATGAGKKKVKTKVTISFQGSDYGDSFSGKVKAKKAKAKLKRKCRKGRKVTVVHRQAGGNERIGTDRSNRRGKWALDAGGLVEPGQYFAKAKKKKVKAKGGGKAICKKRKSKPITVS